MAKQHCSKCNGTGFLSHYAGIKNGICFQCGGKKTRTDSELAAYRKEQQEKNKESDRRAKIRWEYPSKIANAKKFLERFDYDSPFESEEKEKEFWAYIKRQQDRIEKMELELAEANKYIVHQKHVKEERFY
jgi:hypothetical protein